MNENEKADTAPVDAVGMRQKLAQDIYEELFEFLLSISKRRDSVDSQTRDLTGRILKHVKHHHESA